MFLKTQRWRVRFDPNFIVAEKKQLKKATKIISESLATSSESDLKQEYCHELTMFWD